MPLPLDIIFVRHGQSEANIIDQVEEDGGSPQLIKSLRERPDWAHRLTPQGIEQAKITGLWIKDNIGDITKTFKARYYSPFIRARETAAYLSTPETTWRKHNMLHERDWGHYGTVSKAEQASRFPRTFQMHKEAPLYARLDGGEALADNVALRVRDFRDTIRRKWSDQKVIVVTHGETISVARYVFEGMLPEEWQKATEDKSQYISNCSILWYTRVNPNDPRDIRPYIAWRRMIRPDDIAKSPFGGEWQEIPDYRFMTAKEMLDTVDKIPRLLAD